MKKISIRDAVGLVTATVTALSITAAHANSSSDGTLRVTTQPVAIVVAANVNDMTPGLRTAYVRGLQQALQEHGYRPGLVDGKLGHRTRSAIRHYQRDAGLPVDGEATDTLLDHLKFVQPKTMARATRLASLQVRDIQRALLDQGYDPGPIDGVIGKRTRNAIKGFQTDAGLPVTGRADAELLRQLRSVN
jgi:peptidoglycan hydrolase-like protein with peptidoglycan-binding domain